MTKHQSYESPLSTRYASKEMLHLFSSETKYKTWRKLWVALAKGQKKLGLPITDAQIDALVRSQNQLDFDAIRGYEKQFKHEVMANIHAYGDQAPEARGIIHLGATSCYVMDNTDLIQMKEALKILQNKIVQVIRNLAKFSERYADLATLAYTHMQPAQPTTVGKRSCLWLQDFVTDLKDLEYVLQTLPFLGAKGATGTQASFLHLFHHDAKKVEELDAYITKEMGFLRPVIISSQTYSRKQDMRVFSTLVAIAATSHKMATDIRLLSHLEEIEEPFGEHQVGSSAMPHKRNPIHSERVCALSRFLMSLSENPSYTAATQWLERTLDDSANRRLAIAEGFLTADAILNLLINMTLSLVVYPKVIEKNLRKELPQLCLESILLASTAKGKDRQTIHHLLNKHAVESALKRKKEGIEDDLLKRLSMDKDLGLSLEELEHLMHAKELTGLSKHQVVRFIIEEVKPILQFYQDLPEISFRVEM